MNYFFRGVGVIFRDSRLTRFVFTPLLISMGLYIGILLLTLRIVIPWLSSKLEQVHLPKMVAYLSATLGTFFLVWLVAGFLFLLLAAITNSMLWDRLSSEIELQANGVVPRVKLSSATYFGDMVSRSLFVILASLLGVGCGWACFGLPGYLFAGMISLTDYSSCFYLRRGIPWTGQVFRAFRLPGAFGYMACCGLLTMVPIVNVLLLPGMVAGATLMSIDGERRGTW